MILKLWKYTILFWPITIIIAFIPTSKDSGMLAWFPIFGAVLFVVLFYLSSLFGVIYTIKTDLVEKSTKVLFIGMMFFFALFGSAFVYYYFRAKRNDLKTDQRGHTKTKL